MKDEEKEVEEYKGKENKKEGNGGQEEEKEMAWAIVQASLRR